MAHAVKHSQKIGEFLEWCHQQGIELCSDGARDRMFPIRESTEGILARFFLINPAAVEHEKRAVLGWQRKQNDKADKKKIKKARR